VYCKNCAPRHTWPPPEELAYRWLREWFLGRYEDPAENCPYVSSEGGYFYIFGGPRIADEALRAEWEEVFTAMFLDRVAARLEEETGTAVWGDVPMDEVEEEETDAQR
jgi:hypothetical protein